MRLSTYTKPDAVAFGLAIIWEPSLEFVISFWKWDYHFCLYDDV